MIRMIQSFVHSRVPRNPIAIIILRSVIPTLRFNSETLWNLFLFGCMHKPHFCSKEFYPITDLIESFCCISTPVFFFQSWVLPRCSRLSSLLRDGPSELRQLSSSKKRQCSRSQKPAQPSGSGRHRRNSILLLQWPNLCLERCSVAGHSRHVCHRYWGVGQGEARW